MRTVLTMKLLRVVVPCVLVLVTGCSSGSGSEQSATSTLSSSSPSSSTLPNTGKPVIVATNSVLQSIVKLVTGESATVITLVPDGKDPHDFEPSARDIASLSDADLIVQNGLGYEHGLEDSIEAAASGGVLLWTLTDHVTTRGDDPHVFTDPLTVVGALGSLAAAVAPLSGLDIRAAVDGAEAVLVRAHGVVEERIGAIGSGKCRLVTDHDALAYFAARYGCTVVGVVVPSFSSSAEASPKDLEAVRRAAGTGADAVRAIFVEEGAPDAVASRVADQAGVQLVPLRIHALPADNRYDTYVVELAHTILKGLTG